MWTIFFILLSILILGVMPFNTTGMISIEWFDYHLEISLSLLVISILLILVVIICIVYVFFLIKNIPKSIKRYFLEKQQHEDLILLLEGFSAIFKQDQLKAKSIINKINCNHIEIKKLKPIFLLLSAKYNEIQSSEDSLEDIYQELLHFEEYKIISLKGLIEIRMKNNRYYDAMIYAEKALTISSKIKWLLDDLIIIYMELGLYNKIEDIVKKSLKYNFLNKNEANCLLIKAYISYANQFISHSDSKNAVAMLEKVLKLDPTNYDAITIFYRIFAKVDVKLAHKILLNAWKKTPALYLAEKIILLYPDYTITKKVKLVEKLISYATEEKDGYICLIKLYINESMLSNARIVMDKLLTLHAPDHDISKLMAIIEVREQSNHSTILHWINKL